MELADYGLRPEEDWASLIFPRIIDDTRTEKVHVPIGYVLVTQPKFTVPFYSLPSGHRQRKEDAPREEPDATPLDTAARELFGETNLVADIADITLVGQWTKVREWGTHRVFLFTADILQRKTGWMGSSNKQNGGEIPKLFSVPDFYQCVREGGVLPEHYEKLVEYSLILPAGRDRAA